VTVLIIAELTEEERALLGNPRARRLSHEELFRIGPNGLEEISDATLELRLTESERRTLTRQSDPGYIEAIAEELLQMPESVDQKGC